MKRGIPKNKPILHQYFTTDSVIDNNHYFAIQVYCQNGNRLDSDGLLILKPCKAQLQRVDFLMDSSHINNGHKSKIIGHTSTTKIKLTVVGRHSPYL